MFKNLGNLFTLMKNAQQVRGKMEEMKENLSRIRVEGTAGGGMVRVDANGQQRVLSVQIEPSLFASGDREMLEDLVVAAVNAAMEKARDAAAQEMSKIAGDLNLPGMDEALSQLQGERNSE